MTRRYAAVLFDFDYTLADSSPGVVECMRYAFEAMGLPAPGADAVRATIGLSMGETYRALTGNPAPDLPRFKALFVERADQVMADSTTVYPAVGPTVEALTGAGLRLGIVSTKFRYRIETILRRDGLLAGFQAVVGGEDVAVEKPDPSGLGRAMALLGVAPSGALYVGDSAVDGETAARAGVDFAGVLSGPTPAESLRRWNPVAVLSGVGELVGVVGPERTSNDRERWTT